MYFSKKLPSFVSKISFRFSEFGVIYSRSFFFIPEKGLSYINDYSTFLLDQLNSSPFYIYRLLLLILNFSCLFWNTNGNTMQFFENSPSTIKKLIVKSLKNISQFHVELSCIVIIFIIYFQSRNNYTTNVWFVVIHNINNFLNYIII